MAATRTAPGPTLRDSVTRIQRQGERVVARLRHDAGTLITRRRAEFLKELRAVERKFMRALHTASTDQLGRLERRVATLEETVAKLEGRPGSGA